jgi:uncharacterized protein
VSPAELPRVAKEVFDREGGVEYTLAGMLTPKGEPSIRLSLNAVLNLACQRCMERLPVSLAVTKTLVFTREIDELDPVDEEDEDVDAVPLVAKVDVLDLIDEEVMLSLPIAPRHDEGTCELKVEGAPNEPSDSPFSVLSQLKKT